MLNFQGDYEWPGYWSNSEGFANITIVGIEVSLDVFFGINDIGLLSVDPKVSRKLYFIYILAGCPYRHWDMQGADVQYHYNHVTHNLPYSSIVYYSGSVVQDLTRRATNMRAHNPPRLVDIPSTTKE